MILVRAPLRISFMGGGTDLPDFYRHYPGRVLSTTINKFVYIAIKDTPLINKFTAKYQVTEIVAHPSELVHNRIRAALLYLNITKGGLEIGSFADLPAKTGLGSSSSFAVALLKGLYAFLDKKINKQEVADLACRLELELLKEPIGKQDQYAAAFGGFNTFQFNSNDTVSVEPVFMDFKKRALLQSHCLLFFTGISRAAATVLDEQKNKINLHFKTYKSMSDSVLDFKTKLLAGDLRGVANMLYRGWEQKKSLASKISNSVIDEFFMAGMKAGSWGGKILGAGGGGCLLFIAPPASHNQIVESLQVLARQHNLIEAKKIPFNFTQSGADVLFHAKND